MATNTNAAYEEVEEAGTTAPAAAAAAACREEDTTSGWGAADRHCRDEAFSPKDLTQEERRIQVCLFLRSRLTKEGKIERGGVDRAAEAFQCSRELVRSISKKHYNAIRFPERYKLDVRRKEGSGAKCKHDYTEEQVREMIKNRGECKSIRTLAAKVGIPRTSLFRLLKVKGTTPRKTKSAAAKARTRAIPAARELIDKEIEQGQMIAMEVDNLRHKSGGDLKNSPEEGEARAVVGTNSITKSEMTQRMQTMRGELEHEFQQVIKKVMSNHGLNKTAQGENQTAQGGHETAASSKAP